MQHYYVLVFLEFFLLIQSPGCDETVKAADLSKESQHARTRSLFYTSVKPSSRSLFRAREKSQAEMKLNSKNYYETTKVCHHKKQTLTAEDISPDDAYSDDPPPATNIKVADTVVLENKASQVNNQDILLNQQTSNKHPVNEPPLDIQVTPAPPFEADVEEKTSEKLELPSNENQEIDSDENHMDDVAKDDILEEPASDLESLQPKTDQEAKDATAEPIDEEKDSKDPDEKTQPLIGTTDDVIRPTDEPIALDIPSTTPAPTTTSKPDEKPVRIVPPDDDLQSFEEWKKTQIQSQEESASSETHLPHQRTIRTKKTQMNYASQDCGAKILSHNPEAKHVSAILDENKDLYMLNPCKERIWFVVELCEPIQIEQVQLANLELFSSMPHLFELHISERFPAREWRHLGTFEARNERIVQTFASKREEMMFAKYLKFEMKSHFGNEHFCPLTLFRVLGVSMVEEYEEQEEQKNLKERKNLAKDGAVDAAVELTETVSADQSNDDSGSIGNVLNIVKNVVDKVGNLLNGNSESPNATTLENSTRELLPQNDTQDDVIDPEWESPVTLVTNKSEVEEASKKRPIITLIETGDGEELIVAEPFGPPLRPLDFLNRFSAKTFGTKLCWFLEFVYRVTILSCVVPNGNRTVVFGAFPLVIKKIEPEIDVNEVESSLQSETNFVVLNKKVDIETKTENDEILKTELPAIETPQIAKDTPNSTKTGTPNVTKTEKVDQKAEFVAEKDSSRPNSATSSQLDGNTNETLLDEFKQTISGEAHPVCDKHSDQSQTDPKNIKNFHETLPEVEDLTRENVENKDTHSEKSKKTIGEDTAAEEEPETTAQNVAQEEIVSESGGLPADQNMVTNSQNDQASSQAKSDEVEDNKNATTAIPPVKEQNTSKTEDTVVINPGTNQKESVLMRLSNRIRTLEQNLTLSSAYLENLSQRYKRQMDEMQRAFNQTQTRLKEMSTLVEENDLKHAQALEKEKEKTRQLSAELEQLQESTEQLNHDMVARHFCLMALESIILIIIAMTCFVTRQARMFQRIEKRSEEIVNRALLKGTTNMNGCAKLLTPDSHKKASKAKDLNSVGDRIANGNIRLKNASKSKSSLLADKVPPWTISPSPSLSNLSLQRKKSLNKTIGSPIKKRKTNQNGSIKKTNSGKGLDLQYHATVGDNRWATDLPCKSQKLGKTKKQAWKQEGKNGRITAENIPSMKNVVYPNRPRSASFSESPCCKQVTLWQRCTSFSNALVGKAR